MYRMTLFLDVEDDARAEDVRSTCTAGGGAAKP